MSYQPSPTLPKPTIVLVPGTFHTAAHFEPLNKLLQRSSYPTHIVSLPSIGEKAATATLHDDIDAIRTPLVQLAEAEKDIVLVLHSYGGVPGSQAIGGLEKSKRADEEKTGGVIQVLFMDAFVPEEGQNVVEALDGASLPGVKTDGNIIHPKDASSAFYNHLSAEDVEHYSSLLQPQSAMTWTVPVKDACYALDVQITYLYCFQDPCRAVLEKMLAKVKTSSWIVQRIKGDHCPALSNKDGVLRAIEMCLD